MCVHTYMRAHTQRLRVPDLKDAGHGHELCVHLVPVYHIVKHIFMSFLPC